MRVKKQDLLKEFINGDGDIIHSTYKTVNPKGTSKSTTDDHISASRQGMVWMNYRRYYGEGSEKLPYNDVADACSKDPKAFYDFLKDNDEVEVFESYFTYDGNLDHAGEGEEQNLADSELKMKESIININNKYRDADLVKRPEDLPTLEEIESQEPLIIGKFKDIISFVNKHFDNDQKKVLLDYIKENMYNG